MDLLFNYNDIKSDDDIKNVIKILRKQITFPFKKMYLKYSVETLFNNLKKYKCELKEVDKYDINNIEYFKSKMINSKYGNKYVQFINNDDVNYENINILSDYFSEICRIHSKRYDGESPYTLYNNDYYLSKLIKELVDKHQNITWINLREILYKKGECANFKLTLALSVYKYFNGTRILDISSGWGDRLISAIAHEDHLEYYHGFDPSLCMTPQYDVIIDMLAINKNKFVIKNIPFETAKLKNSYNLIFSSPPFFNLEIYNNEDTQSISKYNDKTSWFCHMLIVWLILAWKALELDGHLVVNIEDIIKTHGKYKQTTLYTEAMILFISGFFKKSEYCGVIGHSNIGKTIVRPLWVWKKSNTIDTNTKSIKKKYRRKFRKCYIDEYICIKNTILKNKH